MNTNGLERVHKSRPLTRLRAQYCFEVLAPFEKPVQKTCLSMTHLPILILTCHQPQWSATTTPTIAKMGDRTLDTKTIAIIQFWGLIKKAEAFKIKMADNIR